VSSFMMMVIVIQMMMVMVLVQLHLELVMLVTVSGVVVVLVLWNVVVAAVVVVGLEVMVVWFGELMGRDKLMLQLVASFTIRRRVRGATNERHVVLERVSLVDRKVTLASLLREFSQFLLIDTLDDLHEEVGRIVAEMLHMIVEVLEVG